MAQEIMTQELEKLASDAIVIKQLPVFEEQLAGIKDAFLAETKTALEMPCTEENLSEVKAKRAALNKFYGIAEGMLREAKKQILAPYDKLKEVFDDCLKNTHDDCDEQLKGRIDEVESTLKAEKESKVRDYYYEYAESIGIDFVPFERAGFNIIRSKSDKALREEAKGFLDCVAKDIALIKTQEHATEIMVEYKQTLNVSSAIITVTERNRRIEEEKAKAQESIRIEEANKEAESKVDKVIENLAPPISAPIVEETEKVYRVSFTVDGTLKQIKALKEFLESGGYKYEQQ